MDPSDFLNSPQGTMWIGLSLLTLSALSTIQRSIASAKIRRNKLLTTKSCTTSAPGKALIAGGYLILDSSIGVTIASTSRFFSTIQCLHSEETSPSRKTERVLFLDNHASKNHKVDYLIVLVESPQFHTQFKFYFHLDSSLDVFPASDLRNEFVEKCLGIFFAFASVYYGKSEFISMCKAIASNGQLGIKLRADNDFYSQIQHLQSLHKPLLSSSLKELPRFNPCPVDSVTQKAIVVKTGMGSSAALTTALMAALLQYFCIIDLPPASSSSTLNNNNNNSDEIDDEVIDKIDRDKRILNNLSQLAHAVAQGKLGSGFDVSAAVYGSQFYKRFAPEPLAVCMEPRVPPVALYNAIMSTSLWTQQIVPFTLPGTVQLIMGDVCGGSSSTSMAREVLRWRKDPITAIKAEEIWSRLAVTNSLISQSLISLTTKMQTTEDEAMLTALQIKIESDDGIHWEEDETTFENESDTESSVIIAEMITLRHLFRQSRRLLKHMGDCAGVGIEPNSQTRLADATEKIKGVLCAGVPGAGGVDAIFAIVLSPQARERVEYLWSTWTGSDNSNDRNDKKSGSNNSNVDGANDTTNNKTVVCPLLLSADSEDSPQGARVEPSITW